MLLAKRFNQNHQAVLAAVSINGLMVKHFNTPTHRGRYDVPNKNAEPAYVDREVAVKPNLKSTNVSF